MSLYITKDNQDLLWNVIHKNASMKKKLETLQVEQKIKWFQQIIEKFYRENETKVIDKQALVLMNKQTISHMIKDLRENNNYNIIKTEDSETSSETNNLQEIETPPVVKDNKQQIYLSEFEKRQQEYNSMMNKKIPETIDFSENTESDQVITNMEELIKEQVAARQLDMENIQMSVHPKESEVEILKIEENTNIDIESHELEMQNEEKTKKSVSWEDDMNKKLSLEDRYSRLEIKCNHIIETLEHTVQENIMIKDKYESLEEKCDSIIENLDTIMNVESDVIEKYENLNRYKRSNSL
tara:strand:- start:20417 stop:21307 length:891 start_codon:yes stop_codon:yes gene_type:complete